MTKTEAVKVLGVLCAAFSKTLDDAEVNVWHWSALHDLDYATGIKTAERLAKEDTTWPKPARFNQVRRSIQGGPLEQKALPAGIPEMNKELNTAGIAKAREVLLAARTGAGNG